MPTVSFVSYPGRTVPGMKSNETKSTACFGRHQTSTHPVTAAVRLLQELGGVVVERCPVRRCEACEPLLLVAA